MDRELEMVNETELSEDAVFGATRSRMCPAEWQWQHHLHGMGWGVREQIGPLDSKSLPGC